MVQWLRFHAFSAGGMGSIPGRETKILHAVWPKTKQNKKESEGFLLKASRGDRISKMGDEKFDQISKVGGSCYDGLGRPKIEQGPKSRPRGKDVSEEDKIGSRTKCLSSHRIKKDTL